MIIILRFTAMTAEQLASKLLVAIDTNVFYDLIDSSRLEHQEAQALLDDWLQADIELAVSDELWKYRTIQASDFIYRSATYL
ncbi:MAG: hypothetical protein EOM24_02480 [Chloroflexia bacterium]|nr:hypothetical protein [Chloroflexia bacterium]